MDCDGEPQAHVHAGRVRLHRRVDELPELGELDDLVEPPRHLFLRQPEHDAVDEDVLAPGDLGVEAGAELDECRDPAVDATVPLVGLVIPATSFSSVLLPDPFLPITPSVRPCGSVNERRSAPRTSPPARVAIRLRDRSALLSVANCRLRLYRR